MESPSICQVPGQVPFSWKQGDGYHDPTEFIYLGSCSHSGRLYHLQAPWLTLAFLVPLPVPSASPPPSQVSEKLGQGQDSSGCVVCGEGPALD